MEDIYKKLFKELYMEIDQIQDGDTQKYGDIIYPDYECNPTERLTLLRAMDFKNSLTNLLVKYHEKQTLENKE